MCRCAQNRPLRALAHILLLYDPIYILIADDDTYINIQMLLPGGLLYKHNFIYNTLYTRNVVAFENGGEISYI